MGKGHDHSAHEHGTRATSQNRRRLAVTLVLAGGYMVAEVVGGLLTNSLALLADAGHMLSDVAALGLSLFALWFASRPATPQRSYGYYRVESLNVRGAWLHVLTDALGSVGAIAAGLLIWLLGWHWIDPAVSVLIALLVVYSSWSLLQEAVAVLMEWAPRGIDVDAVRDAMVAVPGVAAVHDLHVWTITSGMDALSAHVEAADGASSRELLKALRSQLHERYGIEHVTLQIEPEGFEEPRPGW